MLQAPAPVVVAGIERQMQINTNDIHYQNDNITMRIDNTQLAAGAMYLNSHSFRWKPHGSPDGICIEWEQIIVNANTNEPYTCVYLMTDFALCWPGVYQRNADGSVPPQTAPFVGAENGGGFCNNHNNGSGGGVNDDDDDEGRDDIFTEFWLVPLGCENVHAETVRIYKAMCECQAMTPSRDANDSDSDGNVYNDDSDEFNGDGWHVAPAAISSFAANQDVHMEQLEAAMHQQNWSQNGGGGNNGGALPENGNSDEDDDRFADAD